MVSRERPRALVLGATGYTGRAVVRSLCARGIETWAHVRPDSARLSYWNGHFEGLGAHVDTTPWEANAFEERLAILKPSAIFALLGTTKKRARSDGVSTYERVDYGLTLLALSAARQLHPPPRILYLSSMGTSPRARSAYLKWRWRTEEELRQLGLPWIIARPCFISGSDREELRPIERLGARLVDGSLRVAQGLGAGALRNKYRSIDAARLATALVSLVFETHDVDMIVEAAQLHALAEG